ncbi:hypothetical protein MTO96_031392 [Rhipicephalus appendiculatus]
MAATWWRQAPLRRVPVPSMVALVQLAVGREICLQATQPYCDISKRTPEDQLKMRLFKALLKEGLEEAALDVAALMAGNQELLQKAKEICAAQATHGVLVARLGQLSSSAGDSTPRQEAPTSDPTAIQEVEALLQGVWDRSTGKTLQPCSAIAWRDQLLAVQTEEAADVPTEEAPDVPGEEAQGVSREEIPDVPVEPLGGGIWERNHITQHRGTDASTERRSSRKRRHRRRRYRRNKHGQLTLLRTSIAEINKVDVIINTAYVLGTPHYTTD